MNDIYKLEFKDIANALRSESKVYLLVLLYLFFEYVRPQSLYPAIDVIPYGKVIIATCLILYLLQKKKHDVSIAANKLMVMFLSVILMSSFLGLSLQLSMSYWSDFMAWLLVYYLIANVVNTEKRFLIFMLLFLLCSFKMAQFSVRGWIHGGRGYSTWGFGGGPGWFQNSGEFGIQMCIFFPLAFYFYLSLKGFWPKWKKLLFSLLPATGFLGLITSSSRGTLVGGAAVVLWMFSKSRYRVKALCGVLLVATLAFQLVPEEQITRLQQAGEDQTSVSRLDNWKKGLKMAEMYPVLGVGYKNWQVADRQIFGGTGLLSHNIFIECLSELGYAGLTIFVLLIFSTFTINQKTRNIALQSCNNENRFIYYMAHGLDAALIGYLVSGFFVTVLFYPYFWINLSMTVALNNIVKTGCASNET